MITWTAKLNSSSDHDESNWASATVSQRAVGLQRQLLKAWGFSNLSCIFLLPPHFIMKKTSFITMCKSPHETITLECTKTKKAYITWRQCSMSDVRRILYRSTVALSIQGGFVKSHTGSTNKTVKYMFFRQCGKTEGSILTSCLIVSAPHPLAVEYDAAGRRA